MTVLSRRVRVRRSGRRPGWLLLTALLVLAIGASSALVFTNRVELLRLAVILALWAAIVAAFVSVIYRRQSDVDQARVRDLKLVYDLQLDREISARREYELTVESQLRRELASELRAQAADEVAALRAELTALRTNLELLFGAELTHRPALETDHATGRDHRDWVHTSHTAPDDRVSNRVTSVRSDEFSRHADDGSIIDVPEEPLPPRPVATDAAAAEAYAGAESHHASSWREPEDGGRRSGPRLEGDAGRRADPGGPEEDRGRSQRTRHGAQPPQWGSPRHEAPPAPFEPRWPQWHTGPGAAPGITEWPPGGAAGQWSPPDTSDSNRALTPAEDVFGTTSAAGASSVGADPPEQRSGRHASTEPEIARPREAEPGGSYGATGHRASGRHSVEYPGADMPAPSWPSESEASWSSRGGQTSPEAAPPSATPRRHHGLESSRAGDATENSGRSVADLLARLQAEPTGGNRRRRRQE
ncbi:MAG: hypothetical protein QJR12_04530 [Mycobacterium sp.]|uniref:DUF6779 domain-containing protein n=1 Tax=Mycobacterium sp. TaxID=1785 RepID=UPI00261F2729|nr:DUF6779 domain-containing protein [Mycobacterium sp.]MDI3313564.1 hypothetical protein [Mycobacterium sp.]